MGIYQNIKNEVTLRTINARGDKGILKVNMIQTKIIKLFFIMAIGTIIRILIGIILLIVPGILAITFGARYLIYYIFRTDVCL